MLLAEHLQFLRISFALETKMKIVSADETDSALLCQLLQKNMPRS